MSKFIDLTGQRFGRLTVIKKAGKTKEYRTLWQCKCDCGNLSIVQSYHLRSGDTQSCGCYARERQSCGTHGQAGTPTYKSWSGMKYRCENSHNPYYKDYGGRGIKVCNRWEKFENFYEDMGKKPEHMTIDRIDVDGDYCKENCRWADYTTQNNNRRNNVTIERNGQTHTLGEWAIIFKINRCTLRTRYYSGDRGDRLFREVRHRECS